MGQQQLILLVLSIIIIGISIAVGITMFQSYAEQSNTDRIMMDLIEIGSNAFAYRIRPRASGGGSGSYNGFDNYFSGLAPGVRENSNGIYFCLPEYISDQGTHVSIRGVSARDETIERWLLIAPNGDMTIYRPGETEEFENNEGEAEGEEEGGGGRGRPAWAGGPPPWANNPGG